MSPARKSAPSRAVGRSRTRRTSASTAARELRAPIVRVEVGRERLDRAVVDLELAVRVAARRDEQQRAAPRAVQLVVVDLDRLPAMYASTGSGIAELAGVDPGEQLVERIHRATILVDGRGARKGRGVACRRRAGRARDGRRDAAQRAAPARLEARRHRRGRLFGSVSGGCVEADVAERAKAISPASRPRSSRTASPTTRRGRSGLPCGGEIDVFVEPFAGAPPIRARHELRRRRRRRSRGALARRRRDAHRAARRQRGGLRRGGRRRRPGSSRSAPATSPRRSARSRSRSAGTRSSSIPRAGLATRERVPSADELLSRGPTRSRSTPTPRSSRSCTRSASTSPRCARGRGRRVLRRRARLAARAGEAPRAARRRSPTGCTARSGSTSAARRRPRSRSRSWPRCSRRGRRARRPSAPRPKNRSSRGRSKRSRRPRCELSPRPLTKPSGDHPDAEHEVQPVVGRVDRDPVAAADEAEDPERQVDGAAADRKVRAPVGGLRQHEADDAEEQVHDVVQDRHLEDAEQLRAGAVAGEAQVAVVGRDPRDEAEDARRAGTRRRRARQATGRACDLSCFPSKWAAG